MALRQQQRIQVAGQRQLALGRSRQRLMVGVLLFVAILAVVALRLFDLSLLQGSKRAGERDLFAALVPPRADIVDRHGAELARTFDAYSIAIRPQDIVGDKRELAERIAAALPGMTYEKALKTLNHPGKYRYLQRRVLPTDAKRVNAIGEPGILLEREPERLYPNLGLGAHVIGYTNIDGQGAAGVERAFDERLTRPDVRGKPLVLSIDGRIQQALEHELFLAMQKFSAIGASGIVMDAKTGEVLAMTSLPELNPNDAGRGSMEARFNRATLGVYELGSTFKPFTVAMGMDAGTVRSMGQMYDCPKGLKVGRFTIRDTHPFNRRCSVAEIMQESSNIGTAQIARELGAARQKEFLQKMGFLEPVSIELKERGRTLSPGNNWGEIATMTVGYGHGIAVTPLHLASGYAALFNGGIWRPATILKVGKDQPLAPGRRVFTEDTSYKMRALLRVVVTEGTGRKADAPGYRVGGKTGTAEKAMNGRYVRNAVITTFAGVFPMDDPRYVVVAMLDEPKPTKETYGFRTAGWNVAPVVSKVVGRIGPVLGVVPDEKREPNMSEVLPYIEPKAKP
ncbi:peptidoglycan D,D-transpeptidase FtsI family protein [Sphingoaurantiacus capsulatus]|uniref:Peptidoglycan D,D-transpeptidase FtsI family protein n=1 Tax=Sphingoaurantiacus capsulatus TaxID=1771310 RepID=A0ABV7XB32_9SPHN